jgi:hypothetical protein
VVVAGDEIGVDAFAVGIVVGEILCLAVNGGREDRLAVDTGDVAVNGIASVQNTIDALGLE